MASLTRKEMEAVLEAGGAVLHGDQILTAKEHLPSAAALARGNPIAEAMAGADLDAEIARLQAQRAALAPKDAPPAKDAPPEKKDGK